MDAAQFTKQCEAIFTAALHAFREEASRVRGVEGDYEERPGIAGRSERHFQATLFEALHQHGFRATVEDAYFGFDAAAKTATADLAVEIAPGVWLWLEIKRVRPKELGFATQEVIRSDAAKLDAVAAADRRNLPQAMLLVFIREDGSREYDAAWYWDSINKQCDVGRWPFARHDIAEVRFDDTRRGQLMCGMWARQQGLVE
jgi:hypothetical protein